ncbi:MAG: hypothetical protein HQL27_08675, partial [Candidatus Omnitrophica bacterium]|nr:hypothetical protein [Candidatus Omnitrophota bacterium]
MFYGEVFKALNKARVKYVVAGGVAVVLHGYRRFTDDLDLAVFLDKRNLQKLYEALYSVGYITKVPVTREELADKNKRNKWIKEKGAIVFSFIEKNPPFKLIDIFIKEQISFKSLFKTRQIMNIDGAKIPVVSMKNLKIMKKMAGRDTDIVDLINLEEIERRINDK